jgi:MYXO-CTERM domain-containing protein
VTLPSGFEVRDGADRPQLIDVTPRSIKQGGAVTLTVQSNAPIGAGPIIDLGPGIFVQSTEVDGDTLRVGIATAIDAPVGAHQIIVDDGLRILSGATVEVRDAKPPPGKVCASSPGQPTGIWALALAACLGLRRRKIC